MPRKHRRSRNCKPVVTNYTLRVTYFAYIQIAPRWRDWSYRKISMREALNLVAAGEAEAVVRWLDGKPQLVGYRATKPTSWERPSVPSLTFSTLIAVGRRALGDRLTRRDRDEVFKYDVWAVIGDTRAPCVRPKISDEERERAMKLLGQPRGARVWAADARQVAPAA